LKPTSRAAKRSWRRSYDDAPHRALKEARSRLPAIQQLAERLSAEDIQITFTFNDDDLVVAARLEELRNLMRAKKTGRGLGATRRLAPNH